MRIEPKQGKDRPDIDFTKWDTVLRICFNRKNRKLRASWTTKEALAIMAQNAIEFASMSGM